jgi:hypothetical protein
LFCKLLLLLEGYEKFQLMLPDRKAGSLCKMKFLKHRIRIGLNGRSLWRSWI